MSEYAGANVGKLVLKGEEKKRRGRKRKSQKEEEIAPPNEPKILPELDIENHGGWRVANTIEDIIGPVAIEFGNNRYVKALDNGRFILGDEHPTGEGPHPQEIFTAIVAGVNKVSFKSGYNKYIRVESDGMVTGRLEAIGAMEKWEPVFEDNRMALQSFRGSFMTITTDGTCRTKHKSALEDNGCRIRIKSCQKEEQENNKNEVGSTSTAKGGDLAETERSYVRKYQNFQDKKLRVSDAGIGDLKKANEEGNLHEVLLNRRSKMKADRYCK